MPICSNCVHYIELENDYPYDGSTCKKFGEMDVITGAIKYDLAAVCRLGDSNCGKKGLHYLLKINLNIFILLRSEMRTGCRGEQKKHIPLGKCFLYFLYFVLFMFLFLVYFYPLHSLY